MASEKVKNHLMAACIVVLIPVLFTLLLFLIVNFGKQFLLAVLGAVITYLAIQIYMVIYDFVEMKRSDYAIAKIKRDKKLAEQLSRVQSKS